jgi:hypothetical protein
MTKRSAILVLVVALASSATHAQETTRTTVRLDWQHLPRTGDMVVFQAARMPASTIYYAVFASGTRVIRVYWDAGLFCRGVFAPAEDPLMECGAPAAYFRVTQARGEMPFVEWVLTPPPLPRGEPG